MLRNEMKWTAQFFASQAEKWLCRKREVMAERADNTVEQLDDTETTDGAELTETTESADTAETSEGAESIEGRVTGQSCYASYWASVYLKLAQEANDLYGKVLAMR